MIIDCHGHYTTAPKSLKAWRDAQVANLSTPELGPKVSDLKISDDEIRESIEQNQLARMRERGIDVTIFSAARTSAFFSKTTGEYLTSNLVERSLPNSYPIPRGSPLTKLAGKIEVGVPL